MALDFYCQKVIKQTCEANGLEPEDLHSEDGQQVKTQQVVKARRQIVTILCRETGLPNTAIAKLIGLKDAHIGRGAFELWPTT